VSQDDNDGFAASGIARAHWASADAVRKIFRKAFESIGLHGLNPHSFRHALALLAERKCRRPEEFKAWSQNLGHESVLTTFSSYGTLPEHRQAEVIKSLKENGALPSDTEALARRISELVHEDRFTQFES
jgi:integrase/recombinase XerD